jgi:hypothetical protein
MRRAGSALVATAAAALLAAAAPQAASAAQPAPPVRANAATVSTGGNVSAWISSSTHRLVTQTGYSTPVERQSVTAADGTSPAISGTLDGVRTKTKDWLAAFQTANHTLAVFENRDSTVSDLQLPMAPGTSPSVIGMDGGHYLVAYVRPDYTVNIWDSLFVTPTATGAQIQAGTSPSMTRTGVNTWEVAFHGQDDRLWVFGQDLAGHAVDGARGGLGLAPGTSPSITSLPARYGAISIAFNAYGSNDLWIVPPTYTYVIDRNGGEYDTHLYMDPKSSPAIVENAYSGINDYPVVAWNTAGTSRALGTATVGFESLSNIAVVNRHMATGSSPSLAMGPVEYPASAVPTAAFLEADSNAVFTHLAGAGDTGTPSGLQAAAGSSPAIAMTYIYAS